MKNQNLQNYFGNLIGLKGVPTSSIAQMQVTAKKP